MFVRSNREAHFSRGSNPIEQMGRLLTVLSYVGAALAFSGNLVAPIVVLSTKDETAISIITICNIATAIAAAIIAIFQQYSIQTKALPEHIADVVGHSHGAVIALADLTNASAPRTVHIPSRNPLKSLQNPKEALHARAKATLSLLFRDALAQVEPGALARALLVLSLASHQAQRTQDEQDGQRAQAEQQLRSQLIKATLSKQPPMALASALINAPPAETRLLKDALEQKTPTEVADVLLATPALSQQANVLLAAIVAMPARRVVDAIVSLTDRQPQARELRKALAAMSPITLANEMMGLANLPHHATELRRALSAKSPATLADALVQMPPVLPVAHANLLMDALGAVVQAQKGQLIAAAIGRVSDPASATTILRLLAYRMSPADEAVVGAAITQAGY
jgi:hypothetical protein